MAVDVAQPGAGARAMNGGYGSQPNFTVRALLPAPPGITSLAVANSLRDRAAKRG